MVSARKLSGTLWSKERASTQAARLQLFGCYMLYEVAGFSQLSGMEMLYKTCSGKNVGGAGYVEKRESAFLVKSIFTIVKNALQKAQVEGGSSISDQIYLHKCFIS